MVYVVYIWGCNKFEPKHILNGSTFDVLRKKLMKVCGVDKFRDIFDYDKAIKLLYDEDTTTPNKKILKGCIDGPGDKNYEILPEHFQLLLKKFYPSASYLKCFCQCRLTFFKCDDDLIDFSEFESEIGEFIV